MFNCRYKTALSALLFLLFLNWSCTKIDTTELGQDLIPVVDNIHTFETTFDVVANNFDDLSTACDSISGTSLHALGTIESDPYFGKTSANIYVEFKPPNFPYTFPNVDSLILDSAIVVLQYTHSFGDTSTLQPQKVQLYELTNALKTDSTYTTCNNFAYNSFNLIGERTYTYKDLTDSIHSLREDAKNQLRIKISTTFAQTFFDTASLKTDSLFKEHFKGFAIVSDPAFGGNALNYFNISNADSRLSLYFSSKKIVKDTLVYDFQFTESSGHANSIIRERGSSEIANNVSHPAGGDSVVYIQTSPGSYAELKIPGLTGLSNRVIHRAELIADQIYSPAPSDQYFTTPQILYLDTKDTSTNGKYIPIPCDFTTVNLQPNFTYFGGIKKLVDDGQAHMLTRYVFNISRYVQTIVTKGSNNATLRLRAPYNIVNPSSYIDRCNQGISNFNFTLNNVAEGRVKLNGTNNTTTRMRLHIIYSTL